MQTFEALQQMDEGLADLYQRAKEAEKQSIITYGRISASYNRQSFYYEIFNKMFVEFLHTKLQLIEAQKALDKIIRMNQSIEKTEFNRPF